jgi:uncharacterized Rmd1/YagE family protein
VATAHPSFPLAGREQVRVRALLLGERLDLRALESTGVLAAAPLTVGVRDSGCAVLFRYGVAVLFDLSPLEEVAFLDSLKPLLVQPVAAVVAETAELLVRPEERERIQGEAIILHALTLERVQLVAEVLARSVVLDRYEQRIDAEFDRVEPFALSLKQRHFSRQLASEVLQHLGGALLSRQQMVGRVALTDKPELLWDHPGLERFYARIEDEYEIRERHLVLEQKMETISRTAETLLGLIQARRSLRVEWYIVVLIVVEILLTLYEMFLRV